MENRLGLVTVIEPVTFLHKQDALTAERTGLGWFCVE
jgi:hypothetical protein